MDELVRYTRLVDCTDLYTTDPDQKAAWLSLTLGDVCEMTEADAWRLFGGTVTISARNPAHANGRQFLQVCAVFVRVALKFSDRAPLQKPLRRQDWQALGLSASAAAALITNQIVGPRLLKDLSNAEISDLYKAKKPEINQGIIQFRNTLP